VLDLVTLDMTEVEIGSLTPPAGGGHFSRRSAIGGGWFFNFNDDGIVFVNLETKEVVQGPAAPYMSRIAFVGAH
jgi:hypothetical protein